MAAEYPIFHVSRLPSPKFSGSATGFSSVCYRSDTVNSKSFVRNVFALNQVEIRIKNMKLLLYTLMFDQIVSRFVRKLRIKCKIGVNRVRLVVHWFR